MATYVKDTRTGYQVKLGDTAGLIDAAITAHEAASNPHPTYLTQAEGDAAYSALGHNHDADYADIAHTHGLNDLTDVTVSTPATDEVIKYNGTSWVNAAAPAGATTLNGLTDVTITSPSSGQVLKYDGTEWKNGTDNTGGAGGLAQQLVTTTTYSALTNTQHILVNAAATTITLPPPNYTVSLLHMDGTNGSTTVTDEIAGNTWTCNYQAQLSTAQQKFGTASLYLDGAQDNLSIPTNSKFNLGTSDYCIEAFVYVTSLAAARALWSRRYNAAEGWCWVISTSGQIYGRLVIGGAWTDGFCITATGVITTNTWYHVAIVRRSGTHYIYVDGVQKSSNAASGAVHDQAQAVRLGVATETTLETPYLGYIDDFRMTIGDSVYTGAFTPPASPLAVIGPSAGAVIGVSPSNGRSDNVINLNGGKIEGSTSNVTLSAIQPVQLEWVDGTYQWRWRIKQGIADGDVIGMIMGLS